MTSMSFVRDTWVVLGKEWLELRNSDSVWVTLSTLATFLLVIGVFLPWQLGILWIQAPWVVVVWGWIPMFLVTTVTADAVAGERERRTLETLLATRLSDASIFWGKWLSSVGWVWLAMLACLPLGLITVNVQVAGGPHLPSLGQAAGTLAAAFAGAGLGAAAGVLVSMRAASVRHAQQVLAIAALCAAFIPVGLLRVLPEDLTMPLLRALMYGSPTRAAWIAAAGLGLASLPLLAAGLGEFRRGHIPLK
jgi:ABC-2 type transport system permease protein